MELKLADVLRCKFEKKLKTWLIQKALGQDRGWFRITRMARNELASKVSSFEEGTRQLMLRSKVRDLITIVLDRNNEKDIKYYAELGDNVDLLGSVPDEIFKPLIPTLLNRTDSLNYLNSKIITGTEDLRELYARCTVDHRELLTHIIADPRCPIDIFVEAVNTIKKDDKLSGLEYGVVRKLEELLRERKVVISWVGGINENRESSAT
jgi:hypothetical protein